MIAIRIGCREQKLALALLWAETGTGRGKDRNSVIRN